MPLYPAPAKLLVVSKRQKVGGMISRTIDLDIDSLLASFYGERIGIDIAGFPIDLGASADLVLPFFRNADPNRVVGFNDKILRIPGAEELCRRRG